MSFPRLVTDRFLGALRFAAEIHHGQCRKGTTLPYLTHLIGTASIALDHGATETEAIAALLHDAIEDQPRNGETRAHIEDTFGHEVLAIVLGCTDCEVDGKVPGEVANWRARKTRYVAHLTSATPSVVLVSASDKLNNARAILVDHHELGAAIFNRFTGRQEGVLWYYRALVTAFRGRVDDRTRRLIDEFDRVVTNLEQASTASG